MKPIYILYSGAIYCIYYFTKSLIVRFNKFKSLMGERSSVDYLLKQIKQQEGQFQGLKYFTRMYILGTPQKIENLEDFSPDLKDYFLISKIRLRQDQQSFFTNKIFKCAPIFKLNNQYNMDIQVNTLNQFIFNMERAIIIFKEKMSVYKSIFFDLNLAKQEIKAGFPYDQQFLIYGDFIYNSDNKTLRCYKIRQLGEIKDHSQFRFQFIFVNTCEMLFCFAMIFSLSFFLYKSVKKILNQDRQFKQVLISKQNQTLRCVICKNRQANIISKPCFHLSCCQECSNEKNCPICKIPIIQQQRVFND